MKLTKTDIVECILAFIGIVGLLAYIHVTAETYQSVALQISPMMIRADWTIQADAGNSALRFRKAALTDAPV
ncbi:MAG TPA: hypothetical protein VJT81_07310 [Burkholderiales bacterium]|nr:hypothetical protein [Burkholderiales bacterium]